MKTDSAGSQPAPAEPNFLRPRAECGENESKNNQKINRKMAFLKNFVTNFKNQLNN